MPLEVVVAHVYATEVGNIVDDVDLLVIPGEREDASRAVRVREPDVDPADSELLVHRACRRELLLHRRVGDRTVAYETKGEAVDDQLHVDPTADRSEEEIADFKTGSIAIEGHQLQHDPIACAAEPVTELGDEVVGVEDADRALGVCPV